MGITCWAPDCYHNNMREKCQFFRFPKEMKEFRKWKRLLRRDADPGPGARVCSCHFKDGDRKNAPEIFEHNVKRKFHIHYLSPEAKKRRVFMEDESREGPSTMPDPIPYMEQKLAEPQPGPSGLSVEIESSPETARSQTTEASIKSIPMLEAEMYLLKLELERKEKMLKTLRVVFTYAHICERDDMISEYTGLPSRGIFESLLFLVQNEQIIYYSKWKVHKISVTDQMLLALMKLRQNFSHADLAFRFDVSVGTVTNVVVTFIHVLHEIIFKKLMNSIPKRTKNKSCLPNCASTFTNCRIILDCTEVISAVPRQSMKKQKLTYSSYKHRNTLKGLVGVAPNGVITYASDLYPGSSSDKAIVGHCGILQQLEAGDLILADKGFLIKDLLPSGVNINVPPFLVTPQFSVEQVRRTECIARARIHVERAIRRMKIFKILNFIPSTLFSYSSVIFKTIAALTNLQYPLLKEVEELYTDIEEQ
ncbi:uncharacterized protein LOC116180298 [Photinus pyralis]|nr:uncharacterized protein LOC116180298 [Photinus pyralis]